VAAASGRHVLYREIAEDIRERIRSGKLAPGEPVGYLPDLRARYGAAQNTVRDALKVLAGEGLIYTVPGKGSFVADDAAAIAARDPADRGQDDSAALSELAGELRAEMAQELGRIEANLVELYGRTGNDYPWEERPGGERPAGQEGEDREQRA
jgi:DNA-binding GntR family transcriptional regulator